MPDFVETIVRLVAWFLILDPQVEVILLPVPWTRGSPVASRATAYKIKQAGGKIYSSAGDIQTRLLRDCAAMMLIDRRNSSMNPIHAASAADDQDRRVL